MELIKAFPETLDQRSIYKMMKSPDVQKMSDADGSVLEVAAWILYNDTDSRTGEIKEILTLQTTSGEMFGTVSGVFQREFKDIVKFFGDDVGEIKVFSGKSKAGRNFLTCSIE